MLVFKTTSATITVANHFKFNEVWQITAYKDNSVYRTKPTGLYISDEGKHILKDLDFIASAISTDTVLQVVHGQTIDVDIIIGFEVE